MTTRKSRFASCATTRSRDAQTSSSGSGGRCASPVPSPSATTTTKRQPRSPLSHVLSPNNATGTTSNDNNNNNNNNNNNASFSESSPNSRNTPTRRHLTTAELTRPSLKVYMEQMTTPPPSSMISPKTTTNKSNNTAEEIAEQLLKQPNVGETKMVLMDLLQTAKENANYKLMLERMKSDEAEYSLKSSRKMSEVTQMYETLREDKMKAEMKIAQLEEEKKTLMTEAASSNKEEKTKAANASIDSNNNVPKTPLTAPAKQASSFSFAATTINDGNNNVGIFASPRWEAVKKSATETAERLRALSSEKGTAVSPFTGGKVRAMKPQVAGDNDDDEDIFVDALNTVAQTQHLNRNKRMTTPTTTKPSVQAVENTQNSISDALLDSNSEQEVKNLLASLDQYVLSLRERMTTKNSGEEASTSARKHQTKQLPGDNKEEEVLKIADKADNSLKSLFSLLFIKENNSNKNEGDEEVAKVANANNKRADRVKSDLLKTFEEEDKKANDDDVQNRFQKEQDERKKDNEKASEALNKVQMLLDEKTDEAKRSAETLETERRKNEALQTQLDEKMKEMERKEKKSVASVSVQTEEVEDDSNNNINGKLSEYESLVASLKEENQGKDVQMLQLQQELADVTSMKNAEFTELTKEVREKSDEVSELSHACSELADALASAEEEVELLREEAERRGEMELKMESLKEALTERKHELNITRSEKKEWEQKCEDLQSEMSFKVAALENLKNSLEELEAKEEHMESCKDLLAEEAEEFERLYGEMYRKNEELIVQHREEKEDMLKMINYLGNDMKMYEREGFIWWTRAELENTRAADLEDEIERLQDELERVNEEQDERTELILDVAKLKEEKLTLEETLEKVDTTNKTLNVRLKKSYERVQELDKEIESANSDCDFLRKEVDEANSRVKVLEAWCTETKVHGEINGDDTNSSDSYDYAKIPARYEELKLENIELMAKLTASKAMEENLSQRLENIMHETDGLKEEAKTAFMKSSEMQKMTENAVEKTAQMTSELEEATNEVQKLENLLAVSRQQVQTLEKQLAAPPRGEIQEAKDGTTAITKEMHPTNENEEDDNAIKEYFEAQNEELTALLASKTNELTQMQAEIENLKNKSSSEEDAKTLRGENYELAVRHKATLERLTATIEEKEALEKSCQNYETTIEKMQVVVKELKMEVEKLKAMKSPAPKKTSHSVHTIEDECPTSSDAAPVRQKIIYVQNSQQQQQLPPKRTPTNGDDEMFYDVADDFMEAYDHNDRQQRHQIRNTQRVSVYPLAPKGQLPPLHRNAIECYHMDAERTRLRKECELEERELFRMKQEKRILLARLKEEKRAPSVKGRERKEVEKKSTKMKKSSRKKSSSSSAATGTEFPAQSLSFKTPQVSTTEMNKENVATNDQSSPSPSSDVLEGCKAPDPTPENGVPTANGEDSSSAVLLETALTAKLVLENSRKADEKAKIYKRQARAAFQSLENISMEMRRMKQAFKEQEESDASIVTPLTESKFLTRT